MGYITKKTKRWPGGIIPYKFLTDPKLKSRCVSASQQTLMRECMRTWERHVNGAANETLIQFQEVNGTPKVFYEIEKADLANGQTSAGSVALMQVDKGRIRFSIRFDRDIGSIPHELAHCIGLAHENERNAPSKFLTLPKDPPRLVYQTTDPNEKKDFLSEWSRYERNASKYVEVGAYDTKSLTHYPRGNGRKWNVDRYNVDVRLPNGTVLRNNERELLNHPSEQQVKEQRWRPSEGDIAAVLALYQD